jgi:hypothetical protein
LSTAQTCSTIPNPTQATNQKRAFMGLPPENKAISPSRIGNFRAE